MTALKCLARLHSRPELPGMHTARNPKHKVKYFENHFFLLLILTTPGKSLL